MEHKANDGMRIHDQKRKLNSSLQPWPEYLMWQWHPRPKVTFGEFMSSAAITA